MSKIVNLRQARKARTRERERQQADENAARFGRNRVEKIRDDDTAKRLSDHLDNHRRDP